MNRNKQENQMNANELIETATRIAIIAGRQWLTIHPEAKIGDQNVYADCLKANIKIRFPEAVRSAEQALGCGMNQVASQTFQASMALAGIDAAKEACCPV